MKSPTATHDGPALDAQDLNHTCRHAPRPVHQCHLQDGARLDPLTAKIRGSPHTLEPVELAKAKHLARTTALLAFIWSDNQIYRLSAGRYSYRVTRKLYISMLATRTRHTELEAQLRLAPLHR
eukprot:SAG31_NODE_1423_length_8400_cov_2.665944_10_plen_123_part_00